MVRCSYDLTQEPWINAVDKEGRAIQLGLYDLFERAHDLRGLDEQNPLVEAALLRLFLALTHRIVQGPATPKEWRAIYRLGRFESSAVNNYFTHWQKRFDLFHPEYPFMQTPGLKNYNNEGHEVSFGIGTQLIHISTGGNKTLFDHHIDEQGLTLNPKDSIKALLGLNAYSFGGTAKKKSNFFGYQQNFFQTVLWKGVFCILKGENLFETLALNTLIYSGDAPIPRTKKLGEDAPTWEWEPNIPVAGPTTPRGYVHYLTARCRHTLLYPEKEEAGLVVRRINIAQGEQFPDIREPFFPYTQNSEGLLEPVRARPDRLLWRDSLSFFFFLDTEDLRPAPICQIGRTGNRAQVPLASRYRCCAFALTSHRANPLSWRKEILSVPLELLKNKEAVAFLQVAIDKAEKCGRLLYHAVSYYIKQCFPEDSKYSDEYIYNFRTLDHFWSFLEAPFQSFLLALEDPDNSEQALQEWGKDLRRTALESFDRCVWQRYADRAKTYQAWVQAKDSLAYKCSKLINKGEG